MRGESGLATLTWWLAALVAFVYVAYGFLHPILGDWNSTADRVIFLVVVGGGGLLVVAGLAVFHTRPWVAAMRIGVGAVVGSIGLLWTLFIPVLALVLAFLCVRRARVLRSRRGRILPVSW